MLEKIRFMLEHGGFSIYLLFAAGIVLTVTAIERGSFLYMKFSFKANKALEHIRSLVLKREYTQALQVCNANLNSPELRVIKAGLIAVEHGREAMKSSLGGAVLEVSRACERRIPLIALIAGISTLLGLLGTITGLIKTFAAIANADAAEKARMLGSGISEAMYATATGLLLGIVAMVVHTLYASKGDEIVGASQDAGYKLVTWVEESERSKVNGR